MLYDVSYLDYCQLLAVEMLQVISMLQEMLQVIYELAGYIHAIR
jgi:hypothetical protein